MTVTGPTFIALQVRDLDRAAAFYQTQLGPTRAPASPPGAVVFDTAPASFAVREPLPGVDLDAARPNPGVGVALWLHADDAQTLHDRLSADGVRITVAPFRRFLSLDIDTRAWPDVAARDPVIADAQHRLPGLRPCGFHSPYEAAAWAVLSQRIHIVQAAKLRDGLVERHGEHGAFPAPQRLRGPDLDLPGRKTESLHAVADAALDGLLDSEALRSVDPDEAIAALQEVRGLGPFAAELVVLRGANAPDALPRHERRLDAEVTERYGADHTLSDISQTWRPYRTWAAVHLRALREHRIAQPGHGLAAR